MAARLSDRELRAWRAFLRAHRAVTGALDAELVDERDVSLGAYEVLLVLARAPDRAMRMSELADAVLLSRSGLTRLIDRMEAEGLVERITCATDARGLLAHLTERGYRRLKEAAPTHLRGIRQHFTGRLSGDQLDALADALESITAAATGPPASG
jgi:DNA-binding MarR family transcriptional regulator